jgi:hypothetical protein
MRTRMRRNLQLLSLAVGLVVTAIVTPTALSHRPYFEEEDISP